MNVTAILVGSVLLTGCAESAVGPRGEGTPSVGEVVCESDGSTTVLTPEVMAQADGVHVRIVSHLDETASVDGLGFDVEPGDTERVSLTPPGTAGIACNPFSNHDSGEVPPTTPIEILDAEDLYLDGELDCGLFSTVWNMIGEPAEAPLEEGVVPLSEARASISGLEAQDEVRFAGYPSSRDRNVVVVRDDNVIASFEFVTFDGEDWVAMSARGCEGSGVRSPL
jgi:hypothetical protein